MVNKYWTPIREMTVELLDATDLYVDSATNLTTGKKTVRELGAAFSGIQRAYRHQIMRSRSKFFRGQLLRNALRRKRSRFLRARAQLHRATIQAYSLRVKRNRARNRMHRMRTELRVQMEQFFLDHDEEVVIIKVEDVSAIRHMKQFREFELQFKFGTSARGSVQDYMRRQMFKLSDGTLHMQPGQRYVMTEDGTFYLREELLQEFADIFEW